MFAGSPLFKDLENNGQNGDTGDHNNDVGEVFRDGICKGISGSISAPDQNLGPKYCADNIPEGELLKWHANNSREWINQAANNWDKSTEHDCATLTIFSDVFFGRADLAWIEELGAFTAKDANAVFPTKPMAKLRTDDRRDRRAERHDGDVEVVVASLHTDARCKESRADQEGVAR